MFVTPKTKQDRHRFVYIKIIGRKKKVFCDISKKVIAGNEYDYVHKMWYFIHILFVEVNHYLKMIKSANVHPLFLFNGIIETF